MSRMLSVLAALLLLAAPAMAEDPKGTQIIWHGQSFFEIVSKSGTRIIVDPHAIEAFGRFTVNKADLVLCSHNHTDHNQLSVVDNIKELQDKNLVFVGTKGDDKKQDWVKIDGKTKDVKFRSVPVYHDDMEGLKRGKNSVLVIEVDGLKIVHLGDIGHTLTPAQLKKIGDADVLMVPVGGIYTVNGIDAMRIVKQFITFEDDGKTLKPDGKHPRYILPMHYGVPGYDDLLDINKSAFLDELDPMQFKVKRFPTTNVLLVDSAEKPAKESIIAILNWEKKTEKEK
jgi:L-ascorbate metabolism protein UlaG (beta-lactamase superfamily)